jgi:hypothetical protein
VTTSIRLTSSANIAVTATADLAGSTVILVSWWAYLKFGDWT